MRKWKSTRTIQEDDFEVAGYLVQPRYPRIIKPDDDPVRIAPQPMSVLKHLAEHPRQVRTIDEIIAAISPGLHVGEGSIYNAITKLREALDDTGDERRIIETATKGYRLIAEVRWLCIPIQSPLDPTPQPGGLVAELEISTQRLRAETPKSRNVKRTRWLYGIGTSILLAAMIYWLMPSAADRRFQKATEALARQEYTEAIDLLREVTQKDYGHADAYETLARTYNITGNKNLALDAIETALELADSQGLGKVRRLYFERRKAQIEGNLDRELACLSDLTAIEPRNPEWRYHLGWFYQTHRRDCSRSLANYQKAIDYSKGAPEPIYYAYLGEALLCCQQAEKAIAVLKDYVASQQASESYRLLGRAYMISGNYIEAKLQLDKSLELADSEFYEVLLSRGELHLARGAYQKAHEEFHEYLLQAEARPNKESEAYWHLALVALRQGDNERAALNAEQAVRFKKHAVPAFWVWGLADLAQGKLSKAQQSAERIASLRSDNGSLHEMEYFHHLSGKIFQQRGELDAAVFHFRQALDLHPIDRAFFVNSLAAALAEQDESDLAEEEYLRVFEFNPSYGPARCGLAKLYQRQGRLEEALLQYKRCLAVFGLDNQEEPLAVDAREQIAKLSTS